MSLTPLAALVLGASILPAHAARALP